MHWGTQGVAMAVAVALCSSSVAWSEGPKLTPTPKFEPIVFSVGEQEAYAKLQASRTTAWVTFTLALLSVAASAIFSVMTLETVNALQRQQPPIDVNRRSAKLEEANLYRAGALTAAGAAILSSIFTISFGAGAMCSKTVDGCR